MSSFGAGLETTSSEFSSDLESSGVVFLVKSPNHSFLVAGLCEKSRKKGRSCARTGTFDAPKKVRIIQRQNKFSHLWLVVCGS